MSLPSITVCITFDYLFHFIQLKDKRQKRLRGIYEMTVNQEESRIEIRRICAYDGKRDSWTFRNWIGADKREAGEEEDPESFLRFSRCLQELEAAYPMKGDEQSG